MINDNVRRLASFPVLALAACSTTMLASSASAQSPVLIASASETPSALTSTSLPDAPDVMLAEPTLPAGGFAQAGSLSKARTAGKYAMVIQPGQVAPKISKHTEVIAGLRDSLTPSAAVGWLVSAGYEQVTNNSPNYGQTGKGFAQRLGAAAARSTSETIFTEAVLAPILHEDPRYYRLGKDHHFFTRLFYAGTRGLLTRTDGGHQTINIANIGGNLAGAALTPVYYPPLNQSGTEVLRTFGGSVGGSALGFVVDEFLPDIFHRNL